ncbi:hypothetical protein C1H46_028715 [Malus baccata]|uniref:Uncharacterized protein n=1 Tax=Malus baccata TaxID=106549 RepID=A0A540LHH1_MALBA|nr:hypothetical protein C1H46_028715 [Malus baccata]
MGWAGTKFGGTGPDPHKKEMGRAGSGIANLISGTGPNPTHLKRTYSGWVHGFFVFFPTQTLCRQCRRPIFLTCRLLSKMTMMTTMMMDDRTTVMGTTLNFESAETPPNTCSPFNPLS